jgi:hypothetical protein
MSVMNNIPERKGWKPKGGGDEENVQKGVAVE